MSVARLCQSAIYLIGLLIAGCARVSNPTPDDYGRSIQYRFLQAEKSCGLTMPIGQDVGQSRIQPGGGGDRVILNGAARIVIFDSSSPTTAEEHDTIILRQAHPTAYHFQRVGADLLICATAYWQEILIVRHYCSDATAEPPWNNEIEEITFADAGETWLSDEIYDGLGDGEEYPGVERIRDHYRVEADRAELAAKGWRVRPFREVLPRSWFTSFYCNEDLVRASAQKELTD